MKPFQNSIIVLVILLDNLVLFAKMYFYKIY